MSRKELMKPVLWSALYPLVMFVALMLLVYLLSDAGIMGYFEHFKGVWDWIYVVGLLFSLGGQTFVHHYFREIKYYEAAKFRYGEQMFENFYPYILAMVLLVGLASIRYYRIHIFFTVLYLLLIAFWDFSGWRNTVSAGIGQADVHRRFSECCRTLCCHIDGMSFLGILLWALVLEVFGGAHKEVLMGGVIGFQMFVVVFLLMVHVFEWQEPEPVTAGEQQP